MGDDHLARHRSATPATSPSNHHHHHHPNPKAPELRLLAESPASSHVARGAGLPGGRSFLASAQWTADGTTVIATSSGRSVTALSLPGDLLEGEGSRELRPQGVTTLPEPTQAVVAAPFFSLADPATQTLLAGCKDHPVHLYHAFPMGEGLNAPLCSYKNIRMQTEEYITPSSMIWPESNHFLCGSANRIDCFDVSGHADGPVVTIHTIPSKRHLLKGGGVGMKGTVSAMGASPSDGEGSYVLAAGTWSRWLGLYDIYRSDKVVANWSIAGAADDSGLDGNGIVQTIWSPCGRYLLVNERQTDGLLVYDIRVTGQLLSTLKGRGGSTPQRLSCDVYPGSDGGFEVWSGAQDGMLHVWEGVGLHGESGVPPSWDWKAHDAPVGNAVVHPSGSVAATCSGGWEPAPVTDDGVTPGITVLEESSLKLWSIEASALAEAPAQEQTEPWIQHDTPYRTKEKK